MSEYDTAGQWGDGKGAGHGSNPSFRLSFQRADLSKRPKGGDES